MPTERWLLVDGSSLIFRSFYGVPKDIRAPDGRLVNAVRGTLEALTRLIRSRGPTGIAIAGDADWRPQRRVDLIPTYKAHRVAEPVPPELIPQLPLIEELLAAVGVPVVNVPDLEAEDVIASWVDQLSHKSASDTAPNPSPLRPSASSLVSFRPTIEVEIEIYSGDRDLF